MSAELIVNVEDNRLSRPDSKAGRLQRAALGALRRHREEGELPTTRRFIFYELEQAGVVSKEVSGARRADQDLQDAITRLTRQGLAPYEWLVDEERSIDRPGLIATTVVEWVRRAVQLSDLIDPWADTRRPLVVTESRGVQGVLRRTVCDEYRCPVTSVRGTCRTFLVNRLGPLLRDGRWRVLYVGDFDLSGGQIEDHTRDVLEREVGVSVPWERVALTEEQVEELQAQGVEPIQKTDKRYNPPKEEEAFETESLGQGELTSLIRSRLSALLPDTLDDVLERERRERTSMLSALEQMEGHTAEGGGEHGR